MLLFFAHQQGMGSTSTVVVGVSTTADLYCVVTGIIDGDNTAVTGVITGTIASLGTIDGGNTAARGIITTTVTVEGLITC